MIRIDSIEAEGESNFFGLLILRKKYDNEKMRNKMEIKTIIRLKYLFRSM